MSVRLTQEVGLADATLAALRAFGTQVRRLWARARRRRRASVFRDELRGLDDHMLRDLGIDRSEIGSVASEMAGVTDPTRLRAHLHTHLLP